MQIRQTGPFPKIRVKQRESRSNSLKENSFKVWNDNPGIWNSNQGISILFQEKTKEKRWENILEQTVIVERLT